MGALYSFLPRQTSFSPLEPQPPPSQTVLSVCAAAFLSLNSTTRFMPHSPTAKPQNRDIHKHRHSVHKRDHQHGIHSLRASLAPTVSADAAYTLLGLPAESLTHITAYLDPTALFILSLVNRRLHEHVEDDNTWRRAYVYQFLGISPEGDIRDGGSPDGAPTKALMLRREESSWKREFVARWNLRRYVPAHESPSNVG